MNWFKHLTASTSDPDLMESEIRFKSKGPYVFWRTIEVLAKEDAIHEPLLINKKVFKQYFPSCSDKVLTNILQYFDQKSRITYKSFGENISIYCSKLSTISSNYSKKVRSTDEHSTDTIEKKLPLEVRSKKKEIEREEEKRNNKKHKYGEYNNVLLKDIELEKLKDKFTDWEAKIKNMDEAIALKGYTYKSHYLAILKWSRNEVVVTEPLEEQLKKQQKAFLEGN